MNVNQEKIIMTIRVLNILWNIIEIKRQLKKKDKLAIKIITDI